jgi:hypothetical protein
LAEAARVWNPPFWLQLPKHRVKKKKGVTWQKVVESTNRGYAKYRLDLSDADQQRLEMGCVAPANLIDEIGTVRMYYRDTGGMIGASCGEETDFIYVEYDAMGHVHGSPITKKELRQRGVKV